MTTITIKVSDPKFAEMLEAMLRSMDFVTDINVDEEQYQLSDEEITLLAERREEYKKDPDKTRSWEEVQAELKEKYGL